MPTPLPLLLTAFEPSGDALAAKLISELRRRKPDQPIYAMGGPEMAEAGATLIESTTDHAVMGAGAVSQALVHRRRVRRLAAWLSEHSIEALIPTDSPAANWAICKQVRRLQPDAKIVHLAAPQLWAWAPWRIHKLRRLTDRVLCLLPFEPDWFKRRGVAATFVGHPLFTADPLAEPPLPIDPPRTPRLTVLPGSRRSELERNWPVMREAVSHFQRELPNISARVALRREADRAALGDVPAGVEVWSGRTESLLAWAEVVLVVSGTATLQVTARRRPMVAVYRANPAMWHGLGRWLVQTRTFTLPNLISESIGRGRAIPELVPHFGGGEAVIEAMNPLMRDADARQHQRDELDAVARCFEGVSFATAAADALLVELSR